MLVLAATPIGNLGDASRRLIEALEGADVVAAEDTRVAHRLLAALRVENRPRLVVVNEHTERDRVEELLGAARTQAVVLVTDAGMPTVSDPGFALVQAAAAGGVPVTVLPGPSAVLAALAVSGLPTDRFAFEGFPPRRAGERRRFLVALATEPRTTVLFESPHRTAALLAAMVEVLGPDRRAVVARELTKLHEEVVRGTLADLRAWADGGVRGEVVVVLAGAAAPPVAEGDAVADVGRLVASGVRLADAAAEVAARTGVPRRTLYDAALAARAADA